MATYAKTTSVSSEKSRAEIEKTLTRYGANSFMYGWDQERALIQFQMQGKQLRFVLQMPDRSNFRYTEKKGSLRSPEAQEKAFDQSVRQKWRALALVIKAKLEAVESGISVFEEEFLSQIVLPNGQTVGGFMVPQLEQVYLTGNMPKLLPSANDQN